MRSKPLPFGKRREVNLFARGTFISSTFSITARLIFLQRLSEMVRSRTPLESSKLQRERLCEIRTLSVIITTTFSVEVDCSKCTGSFGKLEQFMTATSFRICLKTKQNFRNCGLFIRESFICLFL